MRHHAKQLVLPSLTQHPGQRGLRLRHELTELIDHQVMRRSRAGVVCPGERGALHADREETAKEPAGVVVSDRYAAYAHIEPSRRQLCWAHLLRDFTASVVSDDRSATGDAGTAVETWEGERSAAVRRAQQTLGELEHAGRADLTALSVALRTLRTVLRRR